MSTPHPISYQGTHPPAIATPRTPARLISVRAVLGAVLVAVNDAGTIRLIRAARSDEPELDILNATDRAMVASAVHTLAREVRDGS